MALKVQDRIERRLVVEVYIYNVIKYLSERFSISEKEISIVHEPIIGGIVPDLVLIHNNTWFIVEFKTHPQPSKDIVTIMKYKRIIDERIKPKMTIPILAYVYKRPTINAAVTGKVKPLVILHLAGRKYEVLYENVKSG